jgi:hypothetical protein
MEFTVARLEAREERQTNPFGLMIDCANLPFFCGRGMWIAKQKLISGGRGIFDRKQRENSHWASQLAPSLFLFATLTLSPSLPLTFARGLRTRQTNAYQPANKMPTFQQQTHF